MDNFQEESVATVEDRQLEAEATVLFSLPGLDTYARQSQYAGFKGLMGVVGEIRRDFLEDFGKKRKLRKQPSRKMMDNGEKGWQKFVTGWVLTDLQNTGRDDLVVDVEEAATKFAALADSTGGQVGVDTTAAKELVEQMAGKLPEVMTERKLAMGHLPEKQVLIELFDEGASRAWQESSFSANSNVKLNLGEFSKTFAGLLTELPTFTRVLASAQNDADQMRSAR